MAVTKKRKQRKRGVRKRWLCRNHGMLYTDLSWPVVQGCTKISPGCDRCMAEQSLGHCWAWRKSGGKPFALVFNREALDAPTRCKKQWRIFIAPQGDLFHEWVPYEYVKEVLQVVKSTPRQTYFILTKRPKRMKKYLALAAQEGLWPLPNANIGVSAENQEWYDKRMPILVSIPVHELAYRWVACEPLLGPITLGEYGYYIQWLVYGQERANERRTMDREWGDSLVEQCQQMGILFYRHRSHKPWKLQTIKQQQRQEEGMTKLEILHKMPNDGTPTIVLPRSILDMKDVVALQLNNVVLAFAKPGELEDKAVVVPINTASPKCQSPFEQKDSVSVPSEPKAKPKAKPKATKQAKPSKKPLVYRPKDLRKFGQALLEEHGVSRNNYYNLLAGKVVLETTRKTVEKALTKIEGKKVTFEAPTSDRFSF